MERNDCCSKLNGTMLTIISSLHLRFAHRRPLLTGARGAARRGLRASKCRVTSVQTTYCIITSSETISHFHHYHHHSSWSSSSSSSTARMSATAATSTRMCHTVTKLLKTRWWNSKTPTFMLSWSTSTTDIYLDNGWYNEMHMSRSVTYTVGHKTEPISFFINS